MREPMMFGFRAVDDRNDPGGRIRDYVGLLERVGALRVFAAPDPWAQAVVRTLTEFLDDRAARIEAIMTDDERGLLQSLFVEDER